MQTKSILSIVFLLLLMAGTAHAASTSVGVSVARGNHDAYASTLYAQQVYEPWVTGELGEIAPTAEIGASWWKLKHHDDVFGAFLAPGVMLTMFTDQNSLFRPYIGGSVGGSVISDKKFSDWNMGSNLLFRTKGVAGLRFGSEMQHRVQGEYTTHSTWGLTSHHDDFDSYGVSYGFHF